MSGPDLSGKFDHVKPKPASSLLLIRDGVEGLEVFMVRRHHLIDFASGAMVFPGGKVDPEDSDARARAHALDADALDDVALGFQVAAIREAFEEIGVLLAVEADGSALEAARSRQLKDRYAADLEANRVTMGEMAEREDLRFPLRSLVPFAHWITPPVLPKRFDTPFFIAEMPEAQSALASHDGTEAVDSVWVRPGEAIRQAEAGQVTMVFATRLNLVRLAQTESVADALEHARRNPPVVVTPHVYRRGERRMIDIPVEAGFGGPSFDVGAA